MITDGLRTYLLAHGPIAALVVDRIYAVSLLQEIALPAVSMFLVFERQEPMHQGGANAAYESVVRFHVYAGVYADLNALTKLIRERLKEASGAMGSQNVDAIEYMGSRDAETDPDVEARHRILEFRVWWRE